MKLQIEERRSRVVEIEEQGYRESIESVAVGGEVRVTSQRISTLAASEWNE